MKAAEFVGLLFQARDVAHSVHLSTRSYSRHVALQGFYEGIVGLADAFAEAWQGRNGLMGAIALPAVKSAGNASVIDFLAGQLKDIEKARFEIAPADDSALQNIIDEIVALYLSTLYKLRILS